MKLFGLYLRILFKSQLQYRASFLLLSVGQFFIPFTVFAGLYFLFERFGSIEGWDFYEVALAFAVIHMSFALAECLSRGFDTFSSLIVGGDFDRLLVRPRSTVLQVLGSNFEFTRIGRLAQSAIVIGVALCGLHVEWTAWKIIVVLLMIASGTFIFAGIFMIMAALSFWTIQGLEVANVFTDGGREMAQYPLSIYQKWITRFFTFVIPFGCVNYLPLMYVLGRGDLVGGGAAAGAVVGGVPFYYSLSPLVGFLFVVPAWFVWRFGVRHYRSTGS